MKITEKNRLHCVKYKINNAFNFMSSNDSHKVSIITKVCPIFVPFLQMNT